MPQSSTTNEHAEMLRESVTDFVTRASPMQRVRKMRAEGKDFDKVLWREMAKLGWIGVLVPEHSGGLGLAVAEAAIVAEGLSAALVPEPFTAVAVMSATALTGCEDNALSRELLSKLAAGELLPALAWQEGAGNVDVDAVSTRAKAFEAGFRLAGTKRFVAGASAADGFIVSTADATGTALYWVPVGASGLQVTCERVADGRHFGMITLDDVLVPASQRLTSGAAASNALAAARDCATLVASAELLGVMKRALEMSLEYMRTRVQFGKLIGSFQALQHRAVDLYVQQQLSSAVLEDALRRFPALTGGARSALASRVKARCSEAALRIAKETIQIHGAIGFTDEFDAGLYLKRTLVLSAWLGNPALHRRRYAQLGLGATI